MFEQLVNDNSLDSADCCKYHCPLIKDQTVCREGCSDDQAAVATLPNEWMPKHSGPILANYLKEREEKHDKIIEDLNNDACSINRDIDNKVRELAEALVDHIKHNQKDMDQVVDACNHCSPLPPDARGAVLKQVTDLYNVRLDDIAAFKKDALQLEAERVERLKNMLREQFQKVVGVGHHPPKVLIQDFNDRMYHFNQQLFNNMRAYDELEAELTADADENLVRARSALNQLCVGIGVVYRSGSARRPSEKRHPIKSRSLSVGERNRDFDPQMNKLLDNAYDEIDKCVAQLVDAYRQAVMQVFAGFKGHLKSLHKNLTFGEQYDTRGCTGDYCDKEPCFPDLEAMINTAFHHISMTIHNGTSSANTADFLQVTKNDVMNIQKSLVSLGDCLRETYSILHDAGHLCDAHMMRTANAQKLTITAVEDMLTNNDMTEQANELAFNLALEQMLIAPDEDKLKIQYGSLVLMLDRTAEMYQQHSNAEMGRLEQFMNLPPLMANVLLAEMKCFLERNRKIPHLNTKLMTSSASNMIANQRAEIPRAILQTELQESSLHNWRNGFLEALENSVQQIPDELTTQARLWVDDRSTALKNRFAMKLASHGIRAERIKAVYEKRLSELRYHNARLKSHLDAVDELVKRIPVEISEYLGLGAPELHPLPDWVKRINDDMQIVITNPDIDPEVQRLKMCSYAPRLSKHRQLFEQSLDQILPPYRQEIEQRFQNARISSVRYMSSLVLFHEGGNYSVAEAMKVTAALSKAAEMLESAENSAREAVNSRRAQLLAMADHELLPLQKVVEGFVKIKGKVERKKPEKGKKK